MVMLSALQFSLLHFLIILTELIMKLDKSNHMLNLQSSINDNCEEWNQISDPIGIYKAQNYSMLEIINNNENAPTQSL